MESDIRFTPEENSGQTVFVDRYGPEGPPSLLVGCRGQCEAMGVVPIFMKQGEPEVYADDETDPVFVSLWQEMHNRREHDCDGWHFVTCPDCQGTGRAKGFKNRASNLFHWLHMQVRFARYHVVKWPYSEARARAHMQWCETHADEYEPTTYAHEDENGELYFLDNPSPYWKKRMYAERLDVPHPWWWGRKIAFKVLIGRGRRW